MQNNVFLFLAQVVQIYTYILIARIVVSWIQVDRSNQLVQLLHQITDPILEPFRRMIPPIGMMDISPLIVFVLLKLLEGALLKMAVPF